MDGVGESSRERASENILLGSRREASTNEKVIMPRAMTLLPTTNVVCKQFSMEEVKKGGGSSGAKAEMA